MLVLVEPSTEASIESPRDVPDGLSDIMSVLSGYRDKRNAKIQHSPKLSDVDRGHRVKHSCCGETKAYSNLGYMRIGSHESDCWRRFERRG